MRSKKLVLILFVLLTLSPIIAISSSTVPDYTYITPDDWDSGVGVTAGLTAKYTINELEVPEVENVTIPDLAGNQLYVKVMSVEDDIEFPNGQDGVLIRYGLGIIFTTDTTFSVGEGITALDFTIPAGSATPAIVLPGVPHLNYTYNAPSIFFLNNDWSEHAALFNFIGFTVDDTADQLSVSLTNGTGSIAMTWRKTDGLLTALSIDNIYFMGMDLSGISIDISLFSTATKGLNLAVGDEITLNTEIATLNIDGVGDLYTLLNQTEISNYETQFESLQDSTMMKFIVSDIEGLYYKCDVFIYDFATKSLVATDEPLIFNGFMGAIDLEEPPMYYDPVLDPLSINAESSATFIPAVAPVITPDFDICGGYLVLADTIVGVYLDDILDFLPTDAIGGLSLNTIDGDFFLSEKRDFKYFQESLSADIDLELDQEIGPFDADMVLTFDIGATITQDGWLGYHESGVIAGLRLRLGATIAVTSDLTLSGIPTGSVTIDLDFKVVNPDYNPPDPMGGGVIPGYTWIVAIPALLSLAAIGLISRRRK